MRQFKTLMHIYRRLGIKPGELVSLIVILVVFATLEGLGLTLLFPVLQFVQDGGVASGGIMGVMVKAGALVGMPINLATLLLISFVPILLRQGVFFLNARQTSSIMGGTIERARNKSFDALVHADLSHLEAVGEGPLLALLTGLVSSAGTAVTHLSALLAALALIVVYLIAMAFFSWKLTLIALGAILLISQAIRGFIGFSSRTGEKIQLLTIESASTVNERLSAMRLIKMRALESEESAEIARLSSNMRKVMVHVDSLRAGVEILIDPTLMLTVFVIVYVGVTSLGLTLASLGLFLYVLLRLNSKVKEFNTARFCLASLMPAVENMTLMTNAALESRTITSGDRPFEGLTKGIEIRNVKFKYQTSAPDTWVLKGVSLSIPKGSMTALVGRSGSGKSTLVDLIPRLRVPIEGEYLLDGMPADEFDLASLRRKVGFMTQDAIMFNDTIRANLIYGLGRIPTDEEVDSALNGAYCGFVDELPEGLETRIGDRGARLSGGQRQRLALARVLLEDPDILILDEPTSALDSESELFIQKALDALKGSKTLIVIAHRLSTVRSADQIIVLEDGLIMETGTHEQLVEADANYRQLFDKQIQV